MFLDERVEKFLNDVDSDSPAPGGGSVSALVGALGVCLVRMYGHLSIHKKNFLALDDHTKQQFHDVFQQLSTYRQQLSEDILKDTQAYDQVMAAFRLPKSSEEEKEKRMMAIQKATLAAIESPYAIMCDALEALRLSQKMVEHGNVHAISDLACGAIFLDAAIQGAGLNVQINLSSLEKEEKDIWQQKMQAVQCESAQLKEAIVEKIKEMM